MTNVALVVLDTLRKDAFDEMFDWLPGTRFERAWSTSHWTVPSHASLFTGRYASEVGIYTDAESLDCDEPVLAELLSDAGYTTRAFSGNVNVSKPFGYDRGFEQFEGSWRLDTLDPDLFDWDRFIRNSREMGPERFPLAVWQCFTYDCDTVASLSHAAKMKLRDLGYGTTIKDDGAAAALNLVRNTSFGEREFLFMNLMEAHTPYNPPAEYRTGTPPEVDGLLATFQGTSVDEEAIERAYLDSVRYLSDMYEQIFNELREDFDIIITVSDHGELLGEHGAWEHMYGLYPELTHVPLSIYTEDGNNETRTESVSILDVHRTIMSAAGVDAFSRGRSLLTDCDDGEFLTEYHGLSRRHAELLRNADIEDIDHLDRELNGIAVGHYYGHETFEDFEEYGTSPFEDTANYLDQRTAELNKREVVEHGDVDESVRKQLEDLGYA